jgi:endonuclease I/predicted extracellular nuclease
VIASALSCMLATPVMADIIITEYVEGSSNNKALEITNLGNTDVDMGAENYKLAMYSNGDTAEHPDRKIELTGILAAGASYVVYNDSAEVQFQFPDSGATSSVTWFNGDDALVLVKDGVIVDSFGRTGERPDGAWTDSNNADWSTKDKTLRRLASVTSGDGIADDAFPGGNNQWLVFDQNTADGLGCAGETACGDTTTDPDPVENSIIITEYVEGSGNNKALEITNLGGTDVDMGAQSYKLAMYSNGDTAEHPDRKIELTGILAAGASYVVYNDSAEAQFQFPDSGTTSSVTWFNGDDALVLVKGDVIVDSFGRTGERPDGAWTDPNNADWSTKDKTLRRLASVTSGDAIADDAFPGDNNQWLAFDQNTADGLGCSGEGACGGTTNPIDSDNIMITEYVEGNGSNKAVEISNMGSEAVDLGAGNYKFAMFKNGDVTEHADRKIILTTILQPGQSFVIYNEQADEQFQFPDNGAASSLTFFNGDDTLVLTKNNVVVDVFGRVGEDPGSAWTDPNDANWSSQKKTLRRITSVTSGDTIADDAFPGSPNQWQVFEVDTADGLGCPGVTACSDDMTPPASGGIMITEYIEGGSNNKAVEISNMGSVAVDLGAGNYKLAMFKDGDTNEHVDRKIEFTGTLEAGASFVVYNAGAAPEFKFPETGAESSVTWFNGNDAIVLTKDGVIIDVFGRVGEDPGKDDGWLDSNNPDFSSTNKTLRRKSTVTSGDNIADDAFPGAVNEWVVFAIDTSDGLGCPGEEACTVAPPPEPIENFVLITEYVEGSERNIAIELSNIGSADIDLFEMGYALALYSNGNTDSTNRLNLFGLLPSGASIVIYNADALAPFKRTEPAGINSSVTYLNGDDALVLTLNGVVVDSLGRVGEDPGAAWLDANDPTFSTADKTIRRMASVTLGDHIVNNAFPGDNNEWITFDIDTSDGLGCSGEQACTGLEPLPLVGSGGGVTTGACVGCWEISKVSNGETYNESVYYEAAIVAPRTELASAVNQMISAKHVQLAYGQVWSVLTFSDEDPDNTDNVIELYTGNSIAKMMNGSGENANNQDSWNREHVWSKSHGFPERYQFGYTDAHHLRVADWSMNTQRSNLDFDIGGDPVFNGDTQTDNYKDSDSFEPRDEVKGDVARMMFYMATRYNGASEDRTPDLVLIEEVGVSNGKPTFGKLSALLQWHMDDPVDQREIDRNDVIYEYQGNRNPFIDHPEWVNKIYGPNTMPQISIEGPSIVSEGEQVSISAANSFDEDGDELSYHWVQLSNAFISFEFDAQTLTFTAPSVDADTPVEFVLTISDGVNEVSQTFSLVVEGKSSSGGAGSFAWLMLFLLPFAASRYLKKLKVKS